MPEAKKQSIARFDVLGHSYDLPLVREECPTKDRILLEATVLFAIEGYGALSIRDIADRVRISPGALYNHFSSKEALFDAILVQARDLYLLYHEHLDEDLQKAGGFGEMLDIIFIEPLKMGNDYTLYAFALVITEQFRSRSAGRIYTDIFIGYGAMFLEKWFDACVEKGWAKPFWTRMAAQCILSSVMQAILMAVQEKIGNKPPYDYRDILTEMKERLGAEAVADANGGSTLPYSGRPNAAADLGESAWSAKERMLGEDLDSDAKQDQAANDLRFASEDATEFFAQRHADKTEYESESADRRNRAEHIALREADRGETHADD
jgi:AcrR family transcriptional regulator